MTASPAGAEREARNGDEVETSSRVRWASCTSGTSDMDICHEAATWGSQRALSFSRNAKPLASGTTAVAGCALAYRAESGDYENSGRVPTTLGA